MLPKDLIIQLSVMIRRRLINYFMGIKEILCYDGDASRLLVEHNFVVKVKVNWNLFKLKGMGENFSQFTFILTGNFPDITLF